MTADKKAKPKDPKARRPRLNTADQPRLPLLAGCLPRWIAWLIEVWRVAQTTWNNRPR